MLMYALLGLCLVLVGVAGLQFSYLFYVDRIYRERKKYLQSLEQKYARMTERLQAAEKRVCEQNDLSRVLIPAPGIEDDAWADVIEDR